VIPGIGKTIPVFNLASNHQWNVTLSDAHSGQEPLFDATLDLLVHIREDIAGPWIPQL
jgi:hypothetical protein